MLWPRLSGLCSAPFRLQLSELLSKVTLLLNFRLLGDSDMTVLGNALAIGALPQLTHLLLQQNQIGDAGLTSFSDALARGALPALQDVGLFGNPGDAEPVLKVLRERKM